MDIFIEAEKLKLAILAVLHRIFRISFLQNCFSSSPVSFLCFYPDR